MSSKEIWKYELVPTDAQVIAMPTGAKVLSVQAQGDAACVWALVDTDAVSFTNRYFYIVGTGNPADHIDAKGFIGTVQVYNGTLVFHVFEELMTPDAQ